MTNSREAFEREVRYKVIELKRNEPVNGCVVVEKNWPMYETVWQMIENYANGKDWQAALATVEQEPVAWRWKVMMPRIGDGYIVRHEAWRPSKDDAERSERIEAIEPLFTHPQPDSKLVEENARLRDALDACLLMCDFSSIPAIETKTKEALKEKGE